VALATAAGDVSAGVAFVTKTSPEDRAEYRLQPLSVRYESNPGERNRVKVEPAKMLTAIRIRDLAGVTPGRGCEREEPPMRTTVVCNKSASGNNTFRRRDVVLALGDGNDDAAVLGRLLGGVLLGESGDDVLRGGSHSSTFDGGPGDDTMTARGSGDLYPQGPRRNGSDTIRIGSESAVIDYSARTRAITADLGGRANSGERGERDRLVPLDRGFGPSLVGGHGDDRLVGDERGNYLAGGPGRDVLLGERGDDEIFVDEEQRLNRVGTRRTPDVASGGPGEDVIFGNAGPNRLVGGAGLDAIVAGPGNDVIIARDSSADLPHCGPGRDLVVLDELDFFSNDPDPCERVRRTVPGTAMATSRETFPLIGDQSEANPRIRCPGDAPRVCRGTVRLLHKGRELGRRRFSIARNEFPPVRIPLNPRGRGIVLGTENLDGVVVSVTSRDRFGRLRTVRTTGRTLYNSREFDPGGPNDEFS
jgi:Ca2+-binding RTX toxin-like protein